MNPKDNFLGGYHKNWWFYNKFFCSFLTLYKSISSTAVNSFVWRKTTAAIFRIHVRNNWIYKNPTGGHFACACVNPRNDNSVGASNLMAGNRKLARKVTVLLKAISLVLWIPYFPTKNILHDKNRTFSTRVFTCRFFSSRFSWPFKDFQDSTPFSCISLIFTGKAMHFYGLISKLVVLHIREKCIVAMFSCFKTKNEKKIYHARFIY